MTVQRCFFFFFCPRRQSGREKTVHRKKTCVSVLRGKVIPGGNSRETDNILLVWREKLHGNSLTTPPFIFSGGVYRWGDAVKKVGRDFSGGVFVDFSSLPFWLLKGCRDQLLLTFNGPWKKCSSLSPWVVYQFLGSRVTFYFFDVCYLTLSLGQLEWCVFLGCRLELRWTQRMLTMPWWIA